MSDSPWSPTYLKYNKKAIADIQYKSINYFETDTPIKNDKRIASLPQTLIF